ncbi:hypothetical protein JOD43_001532, partial [Pullulanibacillus pueri]|nr:hypothetical protein [Pullulanibacillus pueri]
RLAVCPRKASYFSLNQNSIVNCLQTPTYIIEPKKITIVLSKHVSIQPVFHGKIKKTVSEICKQDLDETVFLSILLLFLSVSLKTRQEVL